MSKEKSEQQLRKLTGKKRIFFVDRGNTAILLSLKLARGIGKTRAFIQDQGGWLTYQQFIEKTKFELNYFESDYGLVRLEDVKQMDENSVMLINSMPGYFTLQKDMKKIGAICQKMKTLLINDVSGSIGTEQAKSGDIILGSFGRWKPVNLEYGGFLAYNESSLDEFFDKHFTKHLRDFYDELYAKLSTLDDRLSKIQKLAGKVKKQLRQFDIIHPDSPGLNVIVRTHSEDQRMEIMDFCRLYGYDFTICPMYIRVLADAVSIELKRLS